MDISELLETAKSRGNLRSDRLLGIKIGIASHTFKRWRDGYGFPSDENLVKLCAIAAVDPVPWLMWLNVQRTRGEAQALYQQVLTEYSPKKDQEHRQVVAAE